MSQTTPLYRAATGKTEKPIVDALVGKYGLSNVTWPIILAKNGQIEAYLYERNRNNGLNSLMDSRPGSRTHLPSFYLEYSPRGNWCEPDDGSLKDFLDRKYTCSYDYICEGGHPYSTVDLDYVWYDGFRFRGFELTTFYMPFTDHDRALELISKMNRRPSWKGAGGAHAFHRIVDGAADLGVDHYMVCVNTTDRVGSELKTDGNVCLFRLTHEQVDRIEKGKKPVDSRIVTFGQFLGWL